ncbi:hypothetical protein H5J25_13730 [Sphingomonas aliaeris]|uniref:Uncharacterized protein n=1 Tax=Sphingomonas aliaeris TaxID=2759526 RepID=A0A974NT59_9SPHN|nr:hypothetical protein [Sphingomonas aliaeris]QQV76505.1 hypothetical protein H5J25_13730 [Sphingomonas aliaeris]
MSANEFRLRPRHRWPDHAERLALYRAGWSDGAIARKQGCKRSAVLQWRKYRGLPTLNAAEPIGANSTRRELYDLGLSDRKIALFEDVTHQTIAEWRKRHGLPAKCKHGPNYGRRLICLDATLRDSLMSVHETIGDPSWSGWLEEMGATVW